MSLHAILEAIRASGDTQVHEIERSAYAQSNQILINARLDAEQAKADACAAAVAPATKERARLIQQARLEALQISGNAREGLVDSALDQIHGRLSSMRTDTAYPPVLRKLIQEALEDLKGSLEEASIALLEADPRDRAVLERILPDMGLDLPVKYELRCWGGVVAKSKDGQVVVINTLEARLERGIPYLRRYLAALFENERCEVETSPFERAFVST